MAGSGEMEGVEAWIPAPSVLDRLGPEAINYNLIEGYCGDPAVTKQRTEVVIEEGVPFSLSLFLSFQPGSSVGCNNIGLGEALRRALLNRVHLRLIFARYK